MSDGKSTEITHFRVEFRLDATVTVNHETWVKPGASTSTTWTDVPTPRELQVARGYMMDQILEPVLSDMVEMITDRVAKTQGL